MSEKLKVAFTAHILNCLVDLLKRKRLTHAEGPNPAFLLEGYSTAQWTDYYFIFSTLHTQPIPWLEL